MKKLSMQELNRLSPKEAKVVAKKPVVLILDNIRSALNVGSVFRTSDAFLIQELALCGITATPPHREIHKTALGATETVDWRRFETTVDAVKHYQAKGFTVFAIEQAQNSLNFNKFIPEPDKPYGLVMGNEVTGVADEVMQVVDQTLEIPQHGAKHSLNVAVCAGIIAWRFTV